MALSCQQLRPIDPCSLLINRWGWMEYPGLLCLPWTPLPNQRVINEQNGGERLSVSALRTIQSCRDSIPEGRHEFFCVVCGRAVGELVGSHDRVPVQWHHEAPVPSQ